MCRERKVESGVGWVDGGGGRRSEQGVDSDLDVSFLSSGDEDGEGESKRYRAELLSKFLQHMPEGFTNITRVFKATTPLLRFTDQESGLEVDFCVNNRLGVRNTKLLAAYCQLDERVRMLGVLVKAGVAPSLQSVRPVLGVESGITTPYELFDRSGALMMFMCHECMCECMCEHAHRCMCVSGMRYRSVRNGVSCCVMVCVGVRYVVRRIKSNQCRMCVTLQGYAI